MLRSATADAGLGVSRHVLSLPHRNRHVPSAKEMIIWTCWAEIVDVVISADSRQHTHPERGSPLTGAVPDETTLWRVRSVDRPP